MVDSQPEYFLKIENPSIFRKTLLEASKSSIEGLKNYEKFRKLRVQKVELIVRLVEIVNDITLLLDRLEKDLPSTHVRESKKQNKTIGVAKKRVATRVKKTQELKGNTTSDKLRQELEEIEERLKSLG